MIQTLLRHSDGSCHPGGVEQVATWREQPDTRLWINIEGELQDAEITLLADVGCDPLAISDAQRLRHPPKIEVFEQNTFVLFRGIDRFGDDLERLAS